MECRMLYWEVFHFIIWYHIILLETLCTQVTRIWKLVIWPITYIQRSILRICVIPITSVYGPCLVLFCLTRCRWGQKNGKKFEISRITVTWAHRSDITDALNWIWLYSAVAKIMTMHYRYQSRTTVKQQKSAIKCNSRISGARHVLSCRSTGDITGTKWFHLGGTTPGDIYPSTDGKARNWQDKATDGIDIHAVQTQHSATIRNH